MAQALLPLKDLVQAKTRLAGLLRPSERRALAQAMAEDVLTVLAGHGEITHITLVSDDPGADMLARHYGAQCWSESALACHGLNPLMQCASERLLSTDDDILLVLHADLPLLTGADISAALRCQSELGGLIIGCDRPGRGTNLLAFNRSSMPQFCFGTDSCAAHKASAQRAGVPVQLLQRLGVGVDVDEPADLHYVITQLHLYPAGKTAGLLYNSELGARVTLACAAMAESVTSVENTNRGLVS